MLEAKMKASQYVDRSRSLLQMVRLILLIMLPTRMVSNPKEPICQTLQHLKFVWLI